MGDFFFPRAVSSLPSCSLQLRRGIGNANKIETHLSFFPQLY